MTNHSAGRSEPSAPSCGSLLKFLLVGLCAVFEAAPRGSEYRLSEGDKVHFWRPDELPLTSGTVCFLWGYYAIISHEGGFEEFRNVEWCNANE